jgi:DeoR/GlpR family transcriptional regulator of sugar metabolism
MLIGERHAYIKEVLAKEGKVIISELSQCLDVSIDTIRRDLQKLSEQGVLQRTHRGALPSSPYNNFAHREQEFQEVKDRLAAATAELLCDGQVIFLDAGTTNVHVAQQLPANLQATIVTNNLPAAMILMAHPTVEVILSGGKISKHCRMVSGDSSVDVFKNIYADVCILGVCSLHVEKGICIPEYDQIHLKKIMIEQSGEVIAPALAEKLGNIYTYKVDAINSLTHLVTESHIPENKIQAFRDCDINVIQID